MAITISCSCTKKLRLQDTFAGKRVKCPACGKGLSVPGPSNGSAAKPVKTEAQERSPFDFFSDSPEPEPAAPAVGHPTPPPKTLPKKDAPVAAAPELATPAPAADLPTPPNQVGDGEKPKSSLKKGKAMVVALVALFLAIAGGLVYCLVLILSSGGDQQADNLSGSDDGDQVTSPNKLSAEERARLARLGKPDPSRLSSDKKSDQKKEQARPKKREEAKKAEIARKEKQKKRAGEIQNLIRTGQDALKNKQLDKAIESFDKLVKLDPNNAAGKRGLDDARKAKKLLEEQQKKEAALQAETRKKQAALDKKVEEKLAPGRKALETYDLATMDKAIRAAEKIAPNHPQVAAAKKAFDQAKKERDGLKDNIKNGRKALRARKYAEAIRLFTLAAKVSPNNPQIEVLLKQAEAGLKRQQLAEAKKLRKKNWKQGVALLNKGRKLLADKKYREAVDALTQADKLVPGDKVIQRLLKKAQSELAVVLRREEAERQKKNAAEVRRLVDVARKALKDKKLDEAAKALADAEKLVPGVPEVKKLLLELDQARKAAAEAARQKALAEAQAARKKLLENFQAKMKAGNTALKAKKFDTAIKEFTLALDLVAKAKDTADQQTEAKKALADAKKAKEKAAKDKSKLEKE
jgi:tetratricopeptide (TPR) repeat protein